MAQTTLSPPPRHFSSPLPELEPLRLFDLNEEGLAPHEHHMRPDFARLAAHDPRAPYTWSRSLDISGTAYDSGTLRYGPSSPSSSSSSYSDPASTVVSGITAPQHPVWVIKCAQCDTLFSNRGMKAVLLLYPGLALYSTDALPRNCSPLATPSINPPPSQERTCACLTQTLFCHGCGNSIGYFIVSPCNACTVATRPNDAPASHNHNGHRLVFHSNGVTATPRVVRLRVNTSSTIENEKHSLHLHETSTNSKAMYWHQLTQAGELSPVLDNDNEWS